MEGEGEDDGAKEVSVLPGRHGQQGLVLRHAGVKRRLKFGI